MKYSELRPKIQNGDVLACAGPWAFSRFIRFMTGEDISHVGVAAWIQFNGGEKRLCIFESVEGHGVRLHPLEHYLQTVFWPAKAQMWWMPIINPAFNGNGIIDYCIQHWGDGYVEPYQFVLGLIPWLQKIRLWFGRQMDTDSEKEHCSELITRAFMAQGYFHDKEPVFTTPGDVTRFACLGAKVLIEEG